MSLSACSQEKGTLDAAAKQLDVEKVNSLEFTGSGSWGMVGQAYSLTSPWAAIPVSNYVMTVDYATPAARVQMTHDQQLTGEGGDINLRKEVAGFMGPRSDQYLSGTYAWGLRRDAVQPQPGTVEERNAEIWSTPHGFVKAALTNGAQSTASETGSEVTFTLGGKYRYVGRINAANDVESVQTWIDDPVMGDMLVETTYSDYRDFNGVRFPAKIARAQAGRQFLDLTVTDVKLNPAVSITVPDTVKSATPAPMVVKEELLAPGVWRLNAGYNSLLIEQADHLVVVEAAVNEQRSKAVIAKAKELVPNKPIRHVINTHYHFDHSGGLRTFVDEGAIVVTHASNRDFFEKAWSAPRTINPDALSQSKKTPMFELFQDKHVLSDGTRSIEIHLIKDAPHNNDGFAMIYLPAEKIVVQGDATNGAGPPEAPNANAANLLANTERLGMSVERIVGVHGPVVPVDELKLVAAGKPATQQ
jgi:hypothetical protein